MRRLIILTIIILTVALLPTWLFSQFSWRLSDTLQQNLPFLLETHRMLYACDLPFWSWNTVLGDSFPAAYAYYTAFNPLALLQAALPLGWIAPSMWVFLYIKLLLTAAFTRLYLRRMGLSDQLADTGSLLFTFSSFTITNLFYWHFIDAAMLFPLLLYALEGCRESGRGRWSLLVIVSALVAASNFYFAPGTFISALLYGLFMFPLRGDGRVWLRCVSGVVLGVALAAPALLVAYYSLAAGTRISTLQFPISLEIMVQDFRRLASIFIPKLIEGDPYEFNSIGYSSSALYLPFIGVLPAALYVLRKRDKLSALILLMLVLYLAPLSGLFTLLRDPMYTRWSYSLLLFIVLAGMMYLRDYESISRRAVRLYALLMVVVPLISWGVNYVRDYVITPLVALNDKTGALSYIVAGLICVNIILLLVWSARSRSMKGILAGVVAMSTLTCMASMFAITHFGLLQPNNPDKMPLAWSESDDWLPCPPAEARTFHGRTANYTEVVNYSLFAGTPTLNGYNSCGSQVLIPFLNTVNDIPGPYPSIWPGKHPASLLTLAGVDTVKVITPERVPDVLKERVRKVSNTGLVKTFVLRSKLAPAYTYDSYLPESEVLEFHENHPQADMPSLLLSHLVVADADTAVAARFMPRAPMTSTDLRQLYDTTDLCACMVNLDSLVACRSLEMPSDFTGDTRGWRCTVNFSQPRILMATVAHDPGFSYFIDGQPVEAITATLGMTALPVPEGKHLIEARFTPPGLLTGLAVAAVALLVFLVSIICRGREPRC